MADNLERDSLDIVRNHIIPAIDRGTRARRLEQRLTGARRSTSDHAVVLTGPVYQLDDVREDGGVDVNGFERLLHRNDLFRRSDLLDIVVVLTAKFAAL